MFISAGVETVSALRQGQLRLAARHAQPDLRRRRGPHRGTSPSTGADGLERPARADEHLPDVYIAMGQTAENLALLKGVTREDMDHFGVRSQNLAEKAIADGFFAREITPVTLPDGTVVSTDDGPRAGVTYEAVSQLKPVFRPDGRVTAGQLLPAQRRRRRAGDHVRHEGGASWASPRWPAWSPPGVSGLSPEIMGLGPVEASQQALARAGHDHRRRRPRRDQRGVRRAGPALGPRPGHRRGDSSTSTAARSRSGHPFGMTGARITTTLHQRPAHARQDDRPGDDVRRRRPGHGDGARAAQLTARPGHDDGRHPPLQRVPGRRALRRQSCAGSSAGAGSRCRARPAWSSGRTRCTRRTSPARRPGWPGRPGRSRAAG